MAQTLARVLVHLIFSTKERATKSAALRGFHWQDGYPAFSVSQSKAQAVERYIARQRERHRKRSFQEELIEFLRMHGVEYDERYLWTWPKRATLSGS